MIGEQIPQHLANGLTLGAVYALIALGYTLVYGVLRMLNFAHGEVYMVGAFVGYGVQVALVQHAGISGWPVIGAMLLAAMAVCGILGMVIERVAYRPLEKTHRLAPLLSALGVSMIIQHAVLLIATANHRAVPVELLLPATGGLELGMARLSPARVLAIIAAGALLLGLSIIVWRSRMGRAMRAIASDREAAEMIGIDVNRVVSLTFFLSSALAGAAGVLVTLVFTRVWHLMGVTAGLKGFTAAVLGGIGSLPGALAGGLTLGIAESLGAGLVSSGYTDLIVFAILILTLLLRPSGLFGQRRADRA